MKTPFEKVKPILNTPEAQESIRKGHIDFPGSEVFDEWNTIPFGQPCGCKEHLIVFVLDKTTSHNVIADALIHLGKSCYQITKLVFFYVDIEEQDWDTVWKLFEPAFSSLNKSSPIQIEIKFAYKRCEHCRCRKSVDYEPRPKGSLKTITNVSEILNGSFDCSNNIIKSLDGAPREVYGNFNCSNNEIASLHGIHEIVKIIDGEIDISCNPINDSLMGLFLIRKLKHVKYDCCNPEFSDLKKAIEIVNNHLETDGSGPSCQIDLLDDGLSRYAKL